MDGQSRIDAAPASRLAAALFALLIALKLGLLAAFGPTFMGDTSDYVRYADAILAGRVNDPDLINLAFPVTLFRIAGYPVLIGSRDAERSQQAAGELNQTHRECSG